METVEWFAEAEEGCTWFSQRLPEPAQIVRVLGGSCEIEAFATGAEGTWIVRNRGVEWVTADAIEDRAPDAWPRAVAFAPDGTPLLLTADVPGPGSPFQVQTWAWAGGAWVERESTTEDVETVRAISGGPLWGSRAPGASVDRWTLEAAPGFALHLPDSFAGTKKMREIPAVFWGTVPVGQDELAVRYTILGVPVPAGPVWMRRGGKRWKLLDDSRFLERPACVEVAGDLLLLSYEGWNPIVVDLATGAVVIDGQTSAGWSGAHLAKRVANGALPPWASPAEDAPAPQDDDNRDAVR